MARQGFVYPPRLSLEFGVEGACDHACVPGISVMEQDEVLAIEREDGLLVVAGESEDFLVGDGVSGLARIVGGEYIVTQFAKLLDDGKGKFSFA